MEYNKIIQGDSLTILKTIPDESIDMIFTDPPYMISQKGLKIDRTNIQNRSLRRNGRKSKELNYDFGEWDHFKSRKDFLEWTESWVKECFRVLKDTGNFVSFFSKSEISHFEDILNEYGHVRQTIVWHKTNPVPQIFKVGFMSSVEFMSWATKQKGAKHTFNHQLGQHHNYIETPICMGKEREDHPTQKPLKAVTWLIEYLTNKDDIVLDPFCGVGTILVACKKMNRRYLGIELKQEYIDMANKRLKGIPESLF
jgi:site-specific DNA-methyltransferase (adenine-specific)/modification methylase